MAKPTSECDRNYQSGLLSPQVFVPEGRALGTMIQVKPKGAFWQVVHQMLQSGQRRRQRPEIRDKDREIKIGRYFSMNCKRKEKEEKENPL